MIGVDINNLVTGILMASKLGVPQTINPLSLVGITVILGVLPLALGLFTSYVKVSIVVGMVRSALGTQHAPSALVAMALSLAVTLFVMAPVIDRSVEKLNLSELEAGIRAPSLDKLASLGEAFRPWREFLVKNAGSQELSFLSAQMLTLKGEAKTGKDVLPPPPSLLVITTAFLLTELKEGFAMAFALLVPFLVIDLVVANILMGMGMMMMSPVMVSLPLKLILFVVSDAWLLLTQGLIYSYGG